MKPFDYQRAERLDHAAGLAREGGTAHRRRHQPARPDEAGGRDAANARRHQPAADGADRRNRRRRPADRRARHQHRLCRRPARAARLSACSPARSWPERPQQLRNKATTGGNLCQRTRCYYFYQHRPALQQARAGIGLRRDGRLQPHPRHSRRQRRMHRHLPGRHGGRPLCARRRGRNRRPTRSSRTLPVREFHRLPGDTPRERQHPRTRRDHHRRRPARRRVAGKQLYRKVRDRASYAFALVSVAADRRNGRRDDRARRARLRRSRAQAVARSADRRSC